MILPERLIFWACITAVATVFGLAISIVVDARLGTTPYWPGALISSALLTLAVSPPLRWISAKFTAVTGEMPPAFGEVESFIFFSALGVCAIRELITRRTHLQITEPAALISESQTARETRLMRRLPANLRAPVQWMSVRDHYVDVQTTAGATSLLMRFADAISELDGADGLQVHRSYWVADAAVASVRRDGGRMTLITHDGAEIPVSRTYSAQVETRCFAKGHAAHHA